MYSYLINPKFDFLPFFLFCYSYSANILRFDFIMLEESRALLVAYFPTGQMPLVTPLVTCSIPLLVSFLALFAHYNDGLCRPAGTRPQHTPAKSILVLSKIFSSNPKVCPGVYEEHSQMDRNPFPTYANGSHHHDPVRYHLLLESQLKGVSITPLIEGTTTYSCHCCCTLLSSFHKRHLTIFG